MAWIKSHQTLRDHPKTQRLARILGIPKPQAIGHMHCLWWWALDYADDGTLSNYDALDIAIGAEWDGDAEAFVAALTTVRFLDTDDDGTLSIHDWDDYAGKLVDRRKANAQRMRDTRAAHVQRTDSARATQKVNTTIARAALEESREEKSRQEQSRAEEEDSLGVRGFKGDAPPQAATPTPQKPPKRGTQVPQDFAVTDTLLSWANENDFTRDDLESQIPRFIDHFTAKGEPRKDWGRSFQNWMRNARDYGHLNRNPNGRYPPARASPSRVESISGERNLTNADLDAMMHSDDPPSVRRIR